MLICRIAYGFPLNISFARSGTQSQSKASSSAFTTPTKPHMLGVLPPVVTPSSVASSSRHKDKGKAPNSVAEGRLSPSRPISDEEDDVVVLASHPTESPLPSPVSEAFPEPLDSPTIDPDNAQAQSSSR